MGDMCTNIYHFSLIAYLLLESLTLSVRNNLAITPVNLCSSWPGLSFQQPSSPPFCFCFMFFMFAFICVSMCLHTCVFVCECVFMSFFLAFYFFSSCLSSSPPTSSPPPPPPPPFFFLALGSGVSCFFNVVLPCAWL